MIVRRLVPLCLFALVFLVGCRSSSGGIPGQSNARLLDDAGVAEPALAAAAREVDAGDGGDAFGLLVDWFRDDANRASEVREYALYLAANALIDDGNRIKAFYYLDELLDLYPGGDLYPDAVARQYAIADSYLDGEGDRFLLLERGHTSDALEMLFRIQQRASGSEVAERALLRTGDYYFDGGDFDFAEDVYTAFLERYPRSPNVARVRLRQAFANLFQYDGPRYSPTPLLDARQQFANFRQQFPEMAREQNLAEIFEYIDEELARKQAIKADYYRRTRRPEAAAALRQQIVQEYPDTRAAAESRELLGLAETEAS